MWRDCIGGKISLPAKLTSLQPSGNKNVAGHMKIVFNLQDYFSVSSKFVPHSAIQLLPFHFVISQMQCAHNSRALSMKDIMSHF